MLAGCTDPGRAVRGLILQREPRSNWYTDLIWPVCTVLHHVRAEWFRDQLEHLITVLQVSWSLFGPDIHAFVQEVSYFASAMSFCDFMTNYLVFTVFLLFSWRSHSLMSCCINDWTFILRESAVFWHGEIFENSVPQSSSQVKKQTNHTTTKHPWYCFK